MCVKLVDNWLRKLRNPFSLVDEFNVILTMVWNIDYSPSHATRRHLIRDNNASEVVRSKGTRSHKLRYHLHPSCQILDLELLLV